MRYVVLLILFSSVSFADQTYATSKQTVFIISCERTLFRILAEYGLGSKSTKDQAQPIIDSCARMSDSIENRNQWPQMSTPAGQGCRNAIDKALTINPRLPKEGDLFAKYCFVITETDK